MTDEKNRTFSELQVSVSVRAHPAWFRLNNQLQWYDNKSQRSQHWYKRLKITQVSLAILIPVMSQLPTPTHATLAASIAGAAIAILEGIQQINQYPTLWIAYRSVAERLQQEKSLFLSSAGPYRDLTEVELMATLSERVEEVLAAEQAKWIIETSQATAQQKSKDT